MVTEADLAVDLCGLRLKTPFILASGVVGLNHEWLVEAARAGAGAVTTKSIGLEPRAGYPEPTVAEWEHGLINAVGLTNPGAVAMACTLAELKPRLASLGVPLIASIFADSVAGLRRVAEIVGAAGPDAIELNISCPNVDDELGRPFAVDPASAAAATRAVRSVVSCPLFVKLSPGVYDIVAIARAVVEAGADAITAVNSLPGMIIDVATGRPVLSHGTGGITGAALRPVAVRAVYEISRAVATPVIGTGGVARGRDAVEMIMAGATAVGVGSAVWIHGPAVFTRLLSELIDYLEDHGTGGVTALRGLAHRR